MDQQREVEALAADNLRQLTTVRERLSVLTGIENAIELPVVLNAAIRLLEDAAEARVILLGQPNLHYPMRPTLTELAREQLDESARLREEVTSIKLGLKRRKRRKPSKQ